MNRPKVRRQAGDTIVEVLIAIAIVSLVLVGAFYVANTSTKTVQDNQEHTEAQQQLQTQVEALRSYLSGIAPAGADGNGNNVIPEGAKYCMGNDFLPHAESDPLCVARAVGGTTAKPTFTRAGNIYTFTIRWDSIKGGTGNEEFIYRAYPTGS